MNATNALYDHLDTRRNNPARQLPLSFRARARRLTAVQVPKQTATGPAPLATNRRCSDNTDHDQSQVLRLTKRLSHARWGLRRQRNRLAELRSELARREARQAQYTAEAEAARAQLEAIAPDALASLHDVSGGAA